MKCVECGYELQGLDRKGKCPECGLRVRRSAAVYRRLARPTSLLRDIGLIACCVPIAFVSFLVIAILATTFPYVLFDGEVWFTCGLPAVAALSVLIIAITRRWWSEVAVFLFVVGMGVLCYFNSEFIYWWGAIQGA